MAEATARPPLGGAGPVWARAVRAVLPRGAPAVDAVAVRVAVAAPVVARAPEAGGVAAVPDAAVPVAAVGNAAATAAGGAGAAVPARVSRPAFRPPKGRHPF